MAMKFMSEACCFSRHQGLALNIIILCAIVLRRLNPQYCKHAPLQRQRAKQSNFMAIPYMARISAAILNCAVFIRAARLFVAIGVVAILVPGRQCLSEIKYV